MILQGTNLLLSSFLVTFLYISPSISTSTSSSYSLYKDDFFPPCLGNGFQLLNANNGYAEPLNIIISAKSDKGVLNEDGFMHWAKSIGFSKECLHLHGGGAFSANLGDGRRWVNQTLELRNDYHGGSVGTCMETFTGGNHFRVYPQKTGAIFLAASEEDDLSEHHTVMANGYDLGRDEIVKSAILGSSDGGITFKTILEDVTGLLNSGTVMNNSIGINHNVPIDGIVKLLTINIVSDQ